jgi:hypothetical protein
VRYAVILDPARPDNPAQLVCLAATVDVDRLGTNLGPVPLPPAIVALMVAETTARP